MSNTRLSVLVVDDCPDAADSTAELLRLEGHAVRVVYSGEGALALARADPPDVVLLDIRMPGVDGWEVARRLRQTAAGRGPVVIAVSGLGSEADRERSAGAGIEAHLVKPVEPGYLVRFLRCIARARAGGVTAGIDLAPATRRRIAAVFGGQACAACGCPAVRLYGGRFYCARHYPRNKAVARPPRVYHLGAIRPARS
jgi:CheY-like chemotaxis protein